MPQRLQSLDALRGFDMLFIMGGAPFFIALATLFPCPFFDAIAGQMDHVEWNGLAHHDTIFPLFLFIAGISFPFSLAKQRLQGKTDAAIYKKIIRFTDQYIMISPHYICPVKVFQYFHQISQLFF